MNRQHPRVLIVEDEPTVAHMLAKIFELWHWGVIKAPTVADALESLQTMRFDLVIVDLMLPDGSGVEVLKKIRSEKLGPETIVSTAMGLDAILELAPLKPDQVLFKPFVFEPLRAAADRIYKAFRPAKVPI